MVTSKTILVAGPRREESQELAAALYDAGHEAIIARNAEEVLRTAVGSNPWLVVIHAAMPQLEGFELRSRLQATGFEIPRIIVFEAGDDLLDDEEIQDGVFVLPSGRSSVPALVAGVRLLGFALDVNGEFGVGLDRVHGDLTQVSFGGLVHALQQHVITGKVSFSTTFDSGLWVVDGAIVDAWRGEIRGVKAFNRLAGLPGGGFSLALESPPDDTRSLDRDIGSMVLEAVEERVELADALAELPSLDSQPEVEVTPDFFNHEFDQVEQATLSSAQDSKTLGEILDRVQATDLEVIRAVRRLMELDILSLVEPEGRVSILTDSTCDLLPIDARRLGIDVVPVSVQIGDSVYKDGVDLQAEAFHSMLRDANVAPRTHPVSKGEFQLAFRRVVPTSDVVAVLCSAALSGSFANAAAAVEEGADEFADLRKEAGVPGVPEIHVIDSKQCSGPLGLLAVFARRMALAGLKAEEISQRLEDLGQRFNTVLMVRQIEFLQRTHGVARREGRSRRDSRWLVRVQDGTLNVGERIEGIHAVARLAEEVVKGIDPCQPVVGCLVQAAAPAEAAELRTRLEDMFNFRELVENQLGPAVTSHNGPGSLGGGVIQLTEEELELFGPSN